MSDTWNAPDKDVTPEPVALSRRRWIKAAGLGTVALAGAGAAWWYFRPGSDEEVLSAGQTQTSEYYPAERHPQFTSVDRSITNEADAARYCNFYEFSSQKNVWNYVSAFEPFPWTLEVTGRVANPRTFDMDSLLQTFDLEERVYRHRCVETWAMVVPWVGFPFSELARHVQPLPDARYVKISSFYRPQQASRQQYTAYPWPYTEGLTLAEATNELTFICTGMYGHPLLKQHGAPVRLVVPWKYGYKSAKSIVRIEFTTEQPNTFWNTLSPNEYGFESNVNPQVPHPRWSQANETMLGTNERRPTQIYNGYGEWVGSLYRS